MPADSRRRDVVVILNGISLKKKKFWHHYFPRLRRICNLQVFETLSMNDAVSLASKAADKYVDLIIAAGGDGTLHQVVNGALSGREKETKLPVIGLIPLGTGNDFARTAGIRWDEQQLIDLIKQFQPRKIDVGCIQYTSFPGESTDPGKRYFVNVADLGMGPIVVDKVLKSGRSFGHAAAYFKAIISTFFSYRPMKVSAKTPAWSWQGKLRSMAIANGRCYGHGMVIAPDAIIDDRMFSVFISGNVSVFDFIWQAPALRKGKYVRLPEVHYKKADHIELTSETPCMIEGDGELLGLLPANVSLVERQLDFLIP